MLVQEKHDQLGLFEKEMSLQKHQIAELKRELALMKVGVCVYFLSVKL